MMAEAAEAMAGEAKSRQTSSGCPAQCLSATMCLSPRGWAPTAGVQASVQRGGQPSASLRPPGALGSLCSRLDLSLVEASILPMPVGVVQGPNKL